MLNNEIFPPNADITYESFFDRSMQGQAFLRSTPAMSLAISRPLFGFCNCGTTFVVACKTPLIMSGLPHKLIKRIFKLKRKKKELIKNLYYLSTRIFFVALPLPELL